MNHKSPVVQISDRGWLHAIRGISNATNERAIVSSNASTSGFGHSAPVIEYGDSETSAVASALVLANMNSIPLDWAARCSVGGMNLSFFIIKQLPVLQPTAYLDCVVLQDQSLPWFEIIIPRVLELTYTSWNLRSFATDLGYIGEPFIWNNDRRHRLQSELDAVYAHIYGLSRDELEWILDPHYPSASFPLLKKNELRLFGEYRTQRYVLAAFDAISNGAILDLAGSGA